MKRVKFICPVCGDKVLIQIDGTNEDKEKVRGWCTNKHVKPVVMEKVK